MLLNLITPTSGEGSLFGQPLHDPLVRARVGFLPEHFRFHEWLTASEFLALHAALYQMDPESTRRRIGELLELVSLTPHRDKRLKQFSKGMLQRIGLAQALLNQPELVILDEPTSGLDPVGRLLVRDIIRELRAAGVTVFLNSHLLSEVEITCDRVAFIKHGQVVKTSPLHTLVAGQVSLEIRAGALPGEVLAGLQHWSDNPQHEALAAGTRVTLTLPSQEHIPEINRYLVEKGIEVFSLTPKQISLDELFLQIIGTDGGL
jgi:ABC-2 type transport system ATP-binding protein